MSAPAHSKSPWTIDGQFDDEVGVTIVSPDGFGICEVYPLTGSWSPEDIANAHALANAPQLMKYLKEACLRFGDAAPEEWTMAVAVAEGQKEAIPA